MAELIFDKSKITDKEKFKAVCPFGALGFSGDEPVASAACKMCKLCVKAGYAVISEKEENVLDKSLFKGICVYADHDEGKIHPVTYELIGKARELAAKVNHPVYCVFIGDGIKDEAKELLHYGVDKVFVYDNPALKNYITQSYTAVFEDFINKNNPSVILVGATTVGRQLAPRIAARFKTGLTADCTILDIKENTDLVQIRPAFGGNIMAEIHTPNNRPQLATVRYKVMNAPERNETANGQIEICTVNSDMLKADVEIIKSTPKPKIKTIEHADVLVVCGKGVKSKDDLPMFQKLADLLGGRLAFTRPMVEAGIADAKDQIGLSGRTVRPKLIITLGVSGAVQFTAGMNNSDFIISVNTDENAPIFKTAHYGIVGNIYEIVPQLISKLEGSK